MSRCYGDFRVGFAPVPRQEFVQTLDGMVRDAGEHISEPGPGIDVIQFRGLCRLRNYAERAHFPEVLSNRPLTGSA